MSNELQVSNSSDSGILALIEKVCLNPEVDVSKMEALLAMKERAYDKDAQIAFNRDMSACQAEMPKVVKDKTNAQTSSKYSSLENILETVKGTYTKHGFSVSFYPGKTELVDHIKVCADLMHSMGHSKTFEHELPVDNKGMAGKVNKTEIHGKASAMSYGYRYLITMMFNIAISDQDDDANKSSGLMEHVNAVKENLNSICALKNSLASDDYTEAYASWSDVNKNDVENIWRAPSKGSILTTLEIKQMKSNEWSAARKEYMTLSAKK